MLGIGLIFAVLLLGGPVHAGPIDATAAYCADRWGSDAGMRTNCETEQYVAQSLLATTVIEPFGHWTLIKETLATCTNRWREKKFNTYDWVMVNSCVDNEFNAFFPNLD